MIKKWLLPIVLLFVVTLSKGIFNDAAGGIINLKSVLLVALGMLLSAFIALTLETVKNLFKSLGAYIQHRERFKEDLISDYLISGEQS